MVSPATPSIVRRTPPPQQHDHKDASKAVHRAGWQAASAVVNCARPVAPAQQWIPMSNINPDPFTTRPEIEGTFGVVTSTPWIATGVGISILYKGCNDFDAGYTTSVTLQVVEP